jgi:LPXTG-motif cell wall-anchored protein
VTVGDEVRWTDTSGSPHTVTRCTIAACDGHDGGTGSDASFTRADIATGGDFTHVFSAPGTYTYYCEFHGYAEMHGTIVVKAAVVTTTTSSPAPPTTSNPTSGTTPTRATAPGGRVTSSPGPGATSQGSPAENSTADNSSSDEARDPGLASTGASSHLAFLAGCVLIATGVLLASTRRRRPT